MSTTEAHGKLATTAANPTSAEEKVGAGLAAYMPGELLALVGPRAVLLADPEVERVMSLWQLIADGASLCALVDAVTSVEPSRLCRFGLAYVDGDDVRMLVRGNVYGETYDERGAASTSVNGRSAASWIEQSVRRPTEVALRAAALVPDTALLYPISGGAVSAVAVGKVLSGSDWRPSLLVAKPDQSEEPEDQLDASEDSARWPDRVSAGQAGHGEPKPAAVQPGDHDGLTTIDRSRVKAGRAGPGTGGDCTPSGSAELVDAARCPGGHLNPPYVARCRGCGDELARAPVVTVPRPSLGVLRFSNGAEIVLSKPVVAGRAPSPQQVTGGEAPTLVTLPSPEQEISRSHVEVRLDGWDVLVVDLGSTNGTAVTVPGRQPERLHPGEPFSIPPGTTVTLADEASAVYEAS
jgi:hypothetical protein